MSSINTRARLLRGLLAGANRYCSCISAENRKNENIVGRVAIGQEIDLFWCAHKAFASRCLFLLRFLELPGFFVSAVTTRRCALVMIFADDRVQKRQFTFLFNVTTLTFALLMKFSYS